MEISQDSKLAMHNNPHLSFTQEQLLRAVKGWCFDCGQPSPSYMVKGEVWKAAWPPTDPYSVSRKKALSKAATEAFPERPRRPDNGRVDVHLNLCFGCLELRLKRRVEITDFIITNGRDVPERENIGIFLGYMLGKRQARRQLMKKAEEDRDKKDEGG